MSTNATQTTNGIIRTMVRSLYDLQDLRIQIGNRITGNFKDKLGQGPQEDQVLTEKELEKEQKKMLEQLRLSYKRITDGVVAKSKAVKVLSEDEIPEGKLPTLAKFVGDGLITTYAELVLVDQYIGLLRDERRHFDRLGNALKGIPVFDHFLTKVDGVGPAIAGVIISEIDIRKCEYSSSLWAYAGLDSVKVGIYTNAAGKELTVNSTELELRYEEGREVYYAEGKYIARIDNVGRSRKSFCLVNREYVNREGENATRVGITFNPFLKTKLMGVLATSFLRSGTGTVNGIKMGAARRLEFALAEGMSKDVDQDNENVQAFLRLKGHTVVVEPSKYAKSYYDYKNRISNDPRHEKKTPLHRNNMALRYMVKRFLVDLYTEWRTVEGLTVAPEYSVAKLGLVHHSAEKYRHSTVAY